jgi:O-antigen/teichoic acid export membrane protein
MRAREWLIVAPAYVIPGLASFVLVPVLFSVLGADEYGRWVLIYGLAVGIPQLSATWLEATTVRFGHRETVDPRLTLVALGASVLMASAGAAIFVPDIDAVGIAVTGIYTAAIASYVLAVARLQVHLRFASLATTAIVRSVLSALFAAAAALVGGTAVAVAAGSTLGYLIGVALTSLPVKGWSRAAAAPSTPDVDVLDSDPPPAREPLRPSVRFAFASAAISVSVFVLSIGDRFILSVFRPIGEVGVYAATYSLADLAGRLVAAIVLVTLRPRVFRAYDAGRAAWARDRVEDAAIVIGWIGVVIGLALLALASLDVPLPIARGLVGPISIGLAALFAATCLGLVFTASGQQELLAGQIGITAAGAVAANLLLIPALGARGAALVTLVMYTVQLVLARRRLPPAERTGRRDPRWLVPAIAAVGVGVAAVSWWGLPNVVLVGLGLGAAAPLPWIRRATLRLLRQD